MADVGVGRYDVGILAVFVVTILDVVAAILILVTEVFVADVDSTNAVDATLIRSPFP